MVTVKDKKKKNIYIKVQTNERIMNIIPSILHRRYTIDFLNYLGI